MQSESTNVSQNVTTEQLTPDDSFTSQHGQHCIDGSPGSLQPHSRELWPEPEPSMGGDTRDATHSSIVKDAGNATQPLGLKAAGTTTPPARDRISEYESARVKTPRKPAEGPLFEVIKSIRRPDDKSCPIAKLPNGELIRSRQSMPMSSSANYRFRGPDSRYCSPVT